MSERNEYQRDLMAERRARARERVYTFLAQPCTTCGNKFPHEAMRLTTGPEGGLPYLGVLVNFGPERLEAELDKLRPICLNCKSVRDND